MNVNELPVCQQGSAAIKAVPNYRRSETIALAGNRMVFSIRLAFTAILSKSIVTYPRAYRLWSGPRSLSLSLKRRPRRAWLKLGGLARSRLTRPLQIWDRSADEPL